MVSGELMWRFLRERGVSRPAYLDQGRPTILARPRTGQRRESSGNVVGSRPLARLTRLARENGPRRNSPRTDRPLGLYQGACIAFRGDARPLFTPGRAPRHEAAGLLVAEAGTNWVEIVGRDSESVSPQDVVLSNNAKTTADVRRRPPRVRARAILAAGARRPRRAAHVPGARRRGRELRRRLARPGRFRRLRRNRAACRPVLGRSGVFRGTKVHNVAVFRARGCRPSRPRRVPVWTTLGSEPSRPRRA